VTQHTARRLDVDGNSFRQSNSEFKKPPLPRRLTRVVEIGCTNLGRATIEGFRQVYGCAPTHLLETWEAGQCVAVECTGLVDV
jgi:hypothetical protein